MIAPRPVRPALLLCAAALAPVSLGIAMHLEHVATQRACMASSVCADAELPTPVATPVPVFVPVAAEIVEPPSTIGALPFAFVVDLRGLHVVLAREIDESWATSAPRFRARPSEGMIDQPAWRDVAIDRLPPELVASIGRTVHLFSTDGRRCTAQIGAPVLVGEAWGDAYDIEEGTDGDQPPRLRASSVWRSGRRTLVAPLTTSDDCGTPLWARDAALPEPAVFLRSEDRAPRAVRTAVLRDPEVRDLAREFARTIADNAESYGVDPQSQPPRLGQHMKSVRWAETDGREVFTFGFHGDSIGYCGGFDPAWAVHVPGDPATVALDTVGDEVLAVLDLDGNGRIEVLSQTWLGPTRLVEIGGPDASNDADALVERASLEAVPLFGCPC